MSENDNKPPSKLTGSVTLKQTSSVPLKKETVRVTLKSTDSFPAVPSATLPPTAPPTIPMRPPTPPPTGGVAPPPSGAPTAPRPIPAPTIALKTAGGTSAGSPTIKLATTNAPVGAPTIALKTANAPLPGSGAPTIPLKTANAPLPGEPGKATVTLPKATVALNPPTQPLSPTGAAATQKATLKGVEEEEESGAKTFSNILAAVGLVAAIVVLGLQLKMASIWIGARDNERIDDWSLLLE